MGSHTRLSQHESRSGGSPARGNGPWDALSGKARNAAVLAARPVHACPRAHSPCTADMATHQTNATEPRQRGHAHNACHSASSEDARARVRRPDPDPRTLDVRLPSARRSRFGLAEITRRNSHPAGCWLRCVRCSRGYSIGRARWLCWRRTCLYERSARSLPRAAEVLGVGPHLLRTNAYLYRCRSL